MAGTTIDIAAIEAELEKLSPEQMKQQLLDAKVRQKVATKKYYNPETAKKARQKRAALLSEMAQRAQGLPATKPGFANLLEQINAEARELADQKMAEDEAEAETEVVA